MMNSHYNAEMATNPNFENPLFHKYAACLPLMMIIDFEAKLRLFTLSIYLQSYYNFYYRYDNKD